MLFFGFALVCLYLVIRNLEVLKLSWELDGPFAWPLVGNVIELANFKNVGAKLDMYARKYSNPFRIWLGTKIVVFITDAENAEMVLRSKDCLNKASLFYNPVKNALKLDGLFTLKADEYGIHRRIVGPVLSESSIYPNLNIFNEIIRRTIEDFPVENKTFDILKQITLCKSSIFMRLAFGDALEPLSQEKLNNSLKRGLNLVSARFYMPIYYIDAIWQRTRICKQMAEAADFVNQTVSRIMAQKIKNSSDGETFIDKLIEISDKTDSFDHEKVLAECVTILIAATDTSAALSAAIAVMLALHPTVQERLFQEVLSVMPEKSTSLTPEQLKKLTFMDHCINETLRLFPSAPTIARESNQPVTLKNGVVVPPGVPLVIGLRQIQMREEYWGPTAHLFDPTRFENTSLKTQPPCSYIPFSYRPRNCPGAAYAKISVKCFITHLVRNYRIETSYKSLQDIRVLQTISIRFVDGYLVSLRERK